MGWGWQLLNKGHAHTWAPRGWGRLSHLSALDVWQMTNLRQRGECSEKRNTKLGWVIFVGSAEWRHENEPLTGWRQSRAWYNTWLVVPNMNGPVRFATNCSRTLNSGMSVEWGVWTHLLPGLVEEGTLPIPLEKQMIRTIWCFMAFV